ncbi:MAG: DNA gyrase subunit A [Gammaproteobacteria bacterium]
MSELAKEILTIQIEDEMKQSYLDYAMSVIVGRALPDVRDGLKPVHRRVLYAMHELGNDWNKAYKKSARIVGDVIGKYHPHGDTAVYDTIVRMAQSFSLRHMLVDGQGNFGSVDGDSPAAMRYTEIRLSKIAHTLLADIDKDTVDFGPNYDESETMPLVLPARFPNLLVNGSSGIAVGMATNIPPHNLGEIIDACVALIDDPKITLEEVIKHIPGPDFPTAGFINGRAGIVEAYKTGRGRIQIRAKTRVEEDEQSGKQAIIIDELPYQVNKAVLQERIGVLVREKKLEGITAIRDESDKDGMRVVIELRRGEAADIILNNLYANTQMQVVFGINMVALDNGRPMLLNVLQMLEAFLQHRREVVTRRTVFELRKARQRAHLLEGLSVALVNIDEIVALIKAARGPQEAKEGLLARSWPLKTMQALLDQDGSILSRPENLAAEFGLNQGEYKLSPEQAQAILDLRLHRLTGLEQDKIFAEYGELLKEIQGLIAILRDPKLLMEVIRRELLEIKDQFGDARRTEIIENEIDLTTEDLIDDETVAVTLSHQGYAKIQPVADYEAQHRGGKGRTLTKVKEEDFVEHLLIANTHDTVLCFSNHGKVYWLKVYQLPHGSAQARGKPIVNLLPLDADEKITAILPVREYSAEKFIFMATERGIVKKISLDNFSRPRTSGIIALALDDGDRLIGVALTDGKCDVMLFTDMGKVIRFSEDDVRPTGRTARGVIGMRLHEGQKIISLVIAGTTGAILTATENGYGKRTAIEEYSTINRGGQGVISIQVSERNGKVIGAVQVYPGDEIMLVNDQGGLVRTPVDEISVIGRNTQGVRLIDVVSYGSKLVSIERLPVVEETQLIAPVNS